MLHLFIRFFKICFRLKKFWFHVNICFVNTKSQEALWIIVHFLLITQIIDYRAISFMEDCSCMHKWKPPGISARVCTNRGAIDGTTESQDCTSDELKMNPCLFEKKKYCNKSTRPIARVRFRCYLRYIACSIISIFLSAKIKKQTTLHPLFKYVRAWKIAINVKKMTKCFYIVLQNSPWFFLSFIMYICNFILNIEFNV